MDFSLNEPEQRARELARAGRYGEAEVVLRAIDPPSNQVWILLGDVLAQQDKHADAEYYFRRAIRNGAAEAAINLGMLLWELGRDDEAEAAYRSVAERYMLAKENLASLLIDNGRTTEAVAVIKQLINAGQKRWHCELGTLLWNSGDVAGAEREFRRGVTAQAENASCYLGHFLWQNGRFDDAESVFRESLRNGDESVCFDYALMLNEIKGREAEAVLYYEKSDDPEALLNLAMLLWSLGETQRARAAFEKAILVDPLAPNTYADFLESIGETDYARDIRLRRRS